MLFHVLTIIADLFCLLENNDDSEKFLEAGVTGFPLSLVLPSLTAVEFLIAEGEYFAINVKWLTKGTK